MTTPKKDCTIKKIVAVSLTFVFALCFSCKKAEAKPVVTEAHGEFGFVCPQIVVKSGITFGLSGNFPKMKDFVNADFLNEGISIKETKKSASGYDVVYRKSNAASPEFFADYTISYKISEKEKTVEFAAFDIQGTGIERYSLKCPEFLTQDDMRKLGEFYGAMNEFCKMIFDMKKMNAAIN